MMRRFMRKMFLVMLLGAWAHYGLLAQNVQEGLRFLDIEQYGNAGKVFRTLASQKPSAENHYYLGYYYLQSGRQDLLTENLDSARVQFEKGIAADANYPLNYVGLGATLIAKGDKAGAKTQFNKATSIKKADKNADVWYRIGESYLLFNNNDPTEAVAALQKATQLDPKKVDAFLLLGDAFKMKLQGTDAANNFDKAIDLDRKSAKGHIRYGKLMINTRNYNDALKKFNEAIQVDPNYAPAYRERGELYFLAKDYQKALTDYEKYMSMSDNSPQAKFKYAGFLLLNGNYDKSRELLEQIAPSQQGNPILYRLLGYAYYETKDYPRGLENIDKFFSTAKPESLFPSDYEYLGKLQIAAGQDTAKGVENIYKAVELDTAKKVLYGEIGDTFFKGKKYDQAAQAFSKAVAAGSTGATAVRNQLYVGLSYLYGKDYVKADSALTQFVAQNPDQYIGTYYLGQAKAGQDPEVKGLAKDSFLKFIETVEGDPEKKEKNKANLSRAYDYMAIYNLKTERNLDQAKVYANKMLELDPNNTRAKGYLQYKQSDLGMSGTGNTQRSGTQRSTGNQK